MYTHSNQVEQLNHIADATPQQACTAMDWTMSTAVHVTHIIKYSSITECYPICAVVGPFEA